MRVNVYAEEMTERVEIIAKEIDGQQFTGLRIYLELPATVNGQQYQGPFMHRPGDDDSSAVTFWGKRDLRVVLRKALDELDKHYAASASPPRAPGASAQNVTVGVESGPGQSIDICERLLFIRAMIGKMCSQGRPPAMTIPADPARDEDLLITDIADEAAAEIRRLRAEARPVKVELDGVLSLLIERNGKVDQTSDVVFQVRELLAVERRAGIEAAAMAARGAKLPDDCIWGRDALEQFDFGKQRAEAAIRALVDAPADGVVPDPWSPAAINALGAINER